jgi:hypothetical protein
VTTPSELGAFLGIVTGVTERPGTGNPLTGAPHDAVYHAREVMKLPAYKKQQDGISKATTRFLRMMSSREDADGEHGVQQEFGMDQYGPRHERKHHARMIVGGNGASVPRDDPFGRLLELQQMSVPAAIIALTNLYAMDQKDVIGIVTKGGKTGQQFDMHMRM